MTDAVRIDNVSFSYGEAPALRDVSLTIEEGEFQIGRAHV